MELSDCEPSSADSVSIGDMGEVGVAGTTFSLGMPVGIGSATLLLRTPVGDAGTEIAVLMASVGVVGADLPALGQRSVPD